MRLPARLDRTTAAALAKPPQHSSLPHPSSGTSINTETDNQAQRFYRLTPEPVAEAGE